MANLNEAFNTYKQPNNKPQYDNYMDRLIKKIPNSESDEIINTQNSINTKFTDINNAFDRVKVSNIKYDRIIRGDKPMYGYVCQLCNGCMGYHLSMQNKHPHDFIKGEYKALQPHEQGPYYDGGIPFLN